MERHTFGVFGSSDEIGFRKGRYRSVHAAARAEMGELNDQSGRHDFVIFAADFYLDSAGDSQYRDTKSAATGRRKGEMGLTAVRTRQSSFVR